MVSGKAEMHKKYRKYSQLSSGWSVPWSTEVRRDKMEKSENCSSFKSYLGLGFLEAELQTAILVWEILSLKKLIIYLFLVALVYYLIILSLLLSQAFCRCKTRGHSSLQHMGFSLCGFSCYGAQALSTQAQQLRWAALGPAGYSHCGTRTLEHGFRSSWYTSLVA